MAGRVVEEKARFLTGPDGVSAEQTRSLDLEEQTTRSSRSHNDRFVQRGLQRVQTVVGTKELEDVLAKFLHGA